MPVAEEKKAEEVVLDKGQQADINSILEDFVPSTQPVVEEKVEEKPVVEEKKDVKEGEERKKEEAGEQKPDDTKPVEEHKEGEVVPPVVVPPVVEEKKVEETELDRIKKENEDFRKQLSDMAERVAAAPQQPKLTPEQKAAADEARKKLPPQIIKFIPDEESFDEVMKTADGFNTLLTGVFNAAVQHSLRLMPQVATQLVDSQITLRSTAQEFYQANPDLIPHKKYVGFVANELAAQHADWDLPTLLQNAEKEVRGRLKLAPVVPGAVNTGVQTNTGNTRTVQDNPGFVPSGGGGRRGTASSDKLTGTEKDIVDLIS
jgi:hypothetical protein